MPGIGVDGCRAGWLGVSVDESDRWEARVFPTFREVYEEWHDGRSHILVDVPIGLPDATSYRTCDSEARSYLGHPRASSVFNPPTRAALGARDWKEAADLNERASGKRITKQTWAIVPKIREVDDFLAEAPELQRRIREVHPEILFQALNGDRPTTANKKSSKGREERLEILARHASNVREFFRASSADFSRAEVGKDDILDAMSAALVAERFSSSLVTMPTVPPKDSMGLRCEMVIPRVTGEVRDGSSLHLEVRSDAGKVLYRGIIRETELPGLKRFVEGRA